MFYTEKVVRFEQKRLWKCLACCNGIRWRYLLKGFSVLTGGGDFDDKARVNIIRVMDMRVPLHDKRVVALVADCVQGLSFAHNVYFITRPFTEVVPFYSLTFSGHRAFPHRPQQYHAQQHQGTVPGRRIWDVFCGSRGTHVMVCCIWNMDGNKEAVSIYRYITGLLWKAYWLGSMMMTPKKYWYVCRLAWGKLGSTTWVLACRDWVKFCFLWWHK